MYFYFSLDFNRIKRYNVKVNKLTEDIHMDKLRSASTDALFEAILTLKTVDECYRFFEDACTVKEIIDISQRFEVAKLLSEKKNYQEISKETGASTATISRVGKCISYGKDGYTLVLERIKENKK